MLNLISPKGKETIDGIFSLFKKLAKEIGQEGGKGTPLVSDYLRKHIDTTANLLRELDLLLSSYKSDAEKVNYELPLSEAINYSSTTKKLLNSLQEHLSNLTISGEQELSKLGVYEAYRDLVIDVKNLNRFAFSSDPELQKMKDAEVAILKSVEEQIEKMFYETEKTINNVFIDKKSEVEKLKLEMEKYCSKVTNRTQLLDEKISGLGSSIKNLEGLYNDKIESIEDIYNKSMDKVAQKEEQIDKLLSTASNRVMADDFDTSAAEEKKAANWLRLGSLGCMAVIIGIVCYSFYDSTHSGFDWESSIFRTVLVFILSIPAAYLSRESAKHREQQYNYHHTALDLKAITPYIASLPDEDQNRIKISIAERIFASRQTNLNQQDSFPLNTQELIVELIKKVDLGDKKKDENKPEQKA